MKQYISREDLRLALPDTSTDLHIAGLDGSVTLYRDTYGIPHVRAQTLNDAFFGQGFATAQDRLWHMDYDRHRAYGRWAELAGRVGLDQDLQMRRFQILPFVGGNYRKLNNETRLMLDAYTAGVNAFIETTDRLPIEYDLVDTTPEPWKPWDCLAVFRVRHILMGVFESKLWRARLVNAVGPERSAEILRGYQPGHLLILPPGAVYEGAALDGLQELSRGVESVNWLRETDAGSNSWVLSGDRTASGSPLLAGDPHRALDTPSVYYQNHVSCPEFDVVGLSFPGYPGFPHYGHNDRVAWSVTHAMADYQDLYVEKFKRGDPARYEWAGVWHQAEVRTETITVKDGSDKELDVTLTRHGPIIAGDPASGYAISFRYTAMDPSSTNTGSEAILPMLRSRSVHELEESMRCWVDPCNNFLFADVSGEIGYLCRGEVPIRSSSNAWIPVPGWTAEHEWKGRVPFEEMPRSRNPSTGYIVTANNRIVGHDFPYYIGLDYAPEFRARPIVDSISGMTGATVSDMAKIHSEKRSIPAQIFRELLGSVKPTSEASRIALARIAAWSGTMAGDETAPTILSVFRLNFDRIATCHLIGTFADVIFDPSGKGSPVLRGQLSAMLVELVRSNNTALLPPEVTWRSIASEALEEALAELQLLFGDVETGWQWRLVHRTKPRHTLSDSLPDHESILNPPRVSIEGDGDTPLRSSFDPADMFTVTGTSVARYIFDLSDWSKSVWVTPLGASGHPGSNHYADQAKIWGSVEFIPMLYNWDTIASNAETLQTLHAK